MYSETTNGSEWKKFYQIDFRKGTERQMINAKRENMLRIIGIVSLLGTVLSLSCERVQGEHVIPYSFYTDIEYGNQAWQRLDIYVPEHPENDRCPVIIFVHGGAWTSGSKEQYWKYNGIEFFRSQSFISIPINYALSAKTDTGVIRHPAHLRDVAKAIRWGYDSIETYGGDPKRIFLMGHSAGAHLVRVIMSNPEFLAAEGLDLSSICSGILLDGGAYLTMDSILMFPRNEKDDPYAYNIANSFRFAFGTLPSTIESVNFYHQISLGKSIPPIGLVYNRNLRYRSKPNEDLRNKLRQHGFFVDDCPTDFDHNQILGNIGLMNDNEIELFLKKFIHHRY